MPWNTQRMRLIVVAALSIVVLVPAALPVPALAGDEADPEITSECVQPALVPGTESLDICSGWFTGLWRLVPREDDPEKMRWEFEGLETTLTVESGMDERAEFSMHAMYWDIDDCTVWWVIDHPVNADDWRNRLAHSCGDGDTQTITIPQSSISIGPDRITIRMMLSDVLGPVAHLFDEGQALEAPRARTWAAVTYMDGPSGTEPQFTTEFDTTTGGNTFVIGQDKPPDPN